MAGITRAILHTVVQRFALNYPSSPLHTLGQNQRDRLLEILQEEIEKEEKIKQDLTPTPEIVRVMRLYVFEGPRDIIEAQIRRSLPEGTRDTGWQGGKLTIHVATIGTFPEVLQTKQPAPADPSPTGPGMMPFPKDRASDR